MTAYKRIIKVQPEREDDLRTHAAFGVKIRPANGFGHEWVIETHDLLERRRVDKIVKLFDTSA